MQNLHQSTWDNDILYADRSSNAEQILIWPFMCKAKNTDMEGY